MTPIKLLCRKNTILTLHLRLNYVAGYTGSLLFLFERRRTQ